MMGDKCRVSKGTVLIDNIQKVSKGTVLIDNIQKTVCVKKNRPR